MQIICFEDADVDRLRPRTRARPAHTITSAITSASFRLIDWLKRIPGKLSGHVRPYLQEIQKLDYVLGPCETLHDRATDLRLVNARLASTVGLDTPLLGLFKSASSSVVIDPECQAVRLAFIRASDLAELPVGQSQDVLDQAATLPQTPLKLDISRWTQDVIEHHMKQMPSAVNWHLNHEEYTEKIAVVRRNVQIGDYQVVDASEGPILLDKKVQVGPFCYLSGPVFLGAVLFRAVLFRAVLFRAGTRVIDHTALKDGVSLGRTVKIVGEVEASSIEPYTNKQHHSFLGHSFLDHRYLDHRYLGSWINLGVGTCNSELKNTYGKINIHYGASKIASGIQFLGYFKGDYSKTAINTSILPVKSSAVAA